MESDVIKRKLTELKKLSKQYRFDEFGNFCKVWNNGMGLLTFITPIIEEKKILVNSFISRKKDIERISEIFKDFEIVKIEYGYPIYYNHTMLSAYKNSLI